jgi:5-methyltetrahydrofolate--homocysteine methyltransferase
MSELQDLTSSVERGSRKDAYRLTKALLNAGTPPMEIVETGLVPAMSHVGEKFKVNQVFVPEMLIAARAMKEAMGVIQPLLKKAGIKPKYTAIIGTVKGDLHDIGKNLVAMMLKGANFNVIDIGTDVPPEKFVAAVKEYGAQVVALSALLTTTMPAMKTIIDAFRAEGMNTVKIMVGGAPITQQFANDIGADGYSADAASAADLAIKLAAA